MPQRPHFTAVRSPTAALAWGGTGGHPGAQLSGSARSGEAVAHFLRTAEQNALLASPAEARLCTPSPETEGVPLGNTQSAPLPGKQNQCSVEGREAAPKVTWHVHSAFMLQTPTRQGSLRPCATTQHEGKCSAVHRMAAGVLGRARSACQGQASPSAPKWNAVLQRRQPRYPKAVNPPALLETHCLSPKQRKSPPQRGRRRRRRKRPCGGATE